MVRTVLKQSISAVAVSYVNNDYGVGIASAFKNEYERLGGDDTAFRNHEEKTTSYRSKLAPVAGNQSQALVVIAYAGDSRTKSVRQSLENDLFDKLISSDGMRDNLLGMTFTAPTSPAASKAEERFEQAYNAGYGSTKDKLLLILAASVSARRAAAPKASSPL